MGTNSQFTVGKLYQNVIEDVVTNVRDTFLDEGVDEQVLSELRMLWESKLMNSKAVENGGFSGDVPIANNGSSGSGGSRKSQASNQAGQSSAPSIRTDVNSIVPIQITMPRQPGDAPGVQKTITVNVPASCIHNNKLQAILSLPKIQEILCSGAPDASTRLQDEVNSALREESGSVIRGNRRSHGSAMMHDFVQADGQAANGDSSEEEDDDELDEEDLDDDFDDKDDDKDDEQEDEGQDEEPLNSGDDVSGDEDPNENIYEVDNVVVCQYDKITRARNKWKFHFKDGIMNLNGKDYVFQKANGDAEW